jgi:hypothetical protein
MDAPRRAGSGGDEDDSVVLRMPVRQAVFRALIASQLVMVTVALMCSGGGGDGSGSSKPVDLRAVVAFLAVLYVDLSILVFVLSYLVIRRFALRLSPEGLSVGDRLTPWSDVAGIEMAKGRTPRLHTPLGGPKPMKLPLPWRGPGGSDSFDRQLNEIRSYWNAHAPALGDGDVQAAGGPAPGSPADGERSKARSGRRGEAVLAGAAVAAVVAATALSWFAWVGTTTTQMVATCGAYAPGSTTPIPSDEQPVVARHRLFLPTSYEMEFEGVWSAVPPPGSAAWNDQLSLCLNPPVIDG